MSAETLRKRRARRGESLEAWLERQRKIDAEQVAQPVHNPAVDEYWYYNTPDCDLELQEGPHGGHGWGDTYDIDADERREQIELARAERELWDKRLPVAIHDDNSDKSRSILDEIEKDDKPPFKLLYTKRAYDNDNQHSD
jgi:hypothetical protein